MLDILFSAIVLAIVNLYIVNVYFINTENNQWTSKNMYENKFQIKIKK